MSDDLYATLGVAREASQDDIKRAYRKLAKEMHPDLNPDKPEVGERFKQVTAAYDILSDPERRRHARELTDGLAAAGAPVVLGVDLNEGPDGPAARWVSAPAKPTVRPSEPRSQSAPRKNTLMPARAPERGPRPASA